MSCTLGCKALLVVGTVLFSLMPATRGGESYVNFEGKQTQPVRLSPSGNRLFAVNTPDARLSVFDISNPTYPVLIAEIPVGIEPVSVNARSDDEAWVVNEVSDSVSIVSVSRRVVVETLPVKDEPADVVFAGGKAFVTAARRNEVHVFDAASHSRLAIIPLHGENPRGLAVSVDGLKVYTAFALSGNRTTLVPADQAPAPPFPTNLELQVFPPPQVSLIVDANDTNWSHVINYTMPDNDVAEIDVASLAVTKYFSRVGTVNLGIAVAPDTGDIYVANTDARNLVQYEPVVRGHFLENRITRIQPDQNVVTPIDLNPGVDYSLMPNPVARAAALAQPTAMVFSRSGRTLFVAAFGTDRIAKLGPAGDVRARIELGPQTETADPRHKRGPRGLALHPVGTWLYVLNRIANTLSIIDTANNFVVSEIPIGSHDPTPAVVRVGRGFLYDAKLSGNGSAACAGCHVDSEMDLLAWDLGNPNGTIAEVAATGKNAIQTNDFFMMHPMKGPMTTQTMKGLRGLEPYHWRGDRTNLMHFNGAFESLMGGTILAEDDIKAFKDFVDTVTMEPNPNQLMDRTYSTNFAGGDAVAGRHTFLEQEYIPGRRCDTCHTADPAPGTSRFIIDGVQPLKVPQLRSIYQKLGLNKTAAGGSVGGFGLMHDGPIQNVVEFLSRPAFGVFATNSIIKSNLSAFVLSFDTGMAPAVGYTRTVQGGNVNSSAVTEDWSLLEAQAAATNIDLIVKGTFRGKLHGFVYRSATGTYLADTLTLGAVVHADLQAAALAGDTFSIMGVPPGSGLRMGVDRDSNGVLDGDEPRPGLRIDLAASSGVIAWSTNAAGYVLEQASNVGPGPWATALGPRTIVADEFQYSSSLSLSNLFFRLRDLNRD